MCYEEGLWQSYLDKELEPEECEIMKEHLQVCTICQEKMHIIQSAQSLTAAALGKYEEEMGKLRYNSALSWEKFQQKDGENNLARKGLFDMNNMLHKRIAAAAIVTILAGSMAFAPVRSMAAQFLQVFRAEKLATVSISINELQEIKNAIEKGTGSIDLNIFGKIEFEGQRKSTEVTLEEIKNAADFPVRLPDYVPEGYAASGALLASPFKVNFNLDVPKVNQLINSLGGQKLLPEAITGKNFSVAFKQSANLNYRSVDGARITINQGKSPEINVDEGVDILELRAAMLDLPILSDQLKQQIAGVEDWEHTLIIPNVDGTTQEVTVNGTKGVFVNQGSAPELTATIKDGTDPDVHGGSVALKGDDLIVEKRSASPGTTLIWNENGLVYTISGAADLDSALKIAASLR